MCNIHIERQLKGVLPELVEDITVLYPILNVQSRSIQHAAFDILSRAIPAQQEAISIEAAISEEAANAVQLPAELLSLILDAPEPVDISDPLTEDEILKLRSYLLSWVLIYSHFTNTSFKLRTIYVEALKEGSYLPPLLDRISTYLLPTPPARPFDASKCDITSYEASTVASSLTLDLQHLHSHLYYLSLRFTPSLVKSWYLSLTNRATVTALESFTSTHLSPLLITSELQTISSRPTDATETESLDIKIHFSTREVTATYPVDDQTMEISLRLPPTFPLAPVEVKPLRRVGMDETHFKRLLLASQAVVNFQSGSLLDALGLFRRNVEMHFQGVSECAICYSILAVTPDRALPNRACQTCKNKFHSTCLLKWFKTSNSSSCPLCKSSSWARGVGGEEDTNDCGDHRSDVVFFLLVIGEREGGGSWWSGEREKIEDRYYDDDYGDDDDLCTIDRASSFSRGKSHPIIAFRISGPSNFVREQVRNTYLSLAEQSHNDLMRCI